jgi:hypothetical protein
MGEFHHPARPGQTTQLVVGFDERPLQLIGETKTPRPTQPGRPRRIDYQYRRNGTCNLFTTIEPLARWRHVEVTERRTAIDFARQVKWLVDVAYPNATVIRVVLDNLNVHAKASLCAAHRRQRRGGSPRSSSSTSHPSKQLAESGRRLSGSS